MGKSRSGPRKVSVWCQWQSLNPLPRPNPIEWVHANLHQSADPRRSFCTVGTQERLAPFRMPSSHFGVAVSAGVGVENMTTRNWYVNICIVQESKLTVPMEGGETKMKGASYPCLL